MKYYENIVKLIPSTLLSSVKHSIFGGTLGLGLGYLLFEKLLKYTDENHDAVDLQNKYVPDNEQYLHLSRNEHFNRIEPPISDFAPVYAMLLGAGCGFFYGVCKSYSKKLISSEDHTAAAENSVHELA